MNKPQNDGADAPGGENTFDSSGALSREFLLERGYCCELGCRNCPYGDQPTGRDTGDAAS